MPRLMKDSDGSVRLQAPAKVNLFLHIVGQRPDGFHELESLFVFTETGDEIRLLKSDQLELCISGPYGGALTDAGGDGPDNLVCRAANVLSEYIGHTPSVRIELIKNLPVASGIGGGSADAAATLVGLCVHWGIEISDTILSDIALQLGADVPACLHTSPLYVEGVGEQLTKRKLPQPYGILLVNPMVPLSTPAVFKAYASLNEGRFDPRRSNEFSWPLDNDAFIQFLKAKTHNALQGPAESLSSEISEVLSVLEQTDKSLFSAMSGSGATCFALFETKEQAVSAAADISRVCPKWWVMADALTTD